MKKVCIFLSLLTGILLLFSPALDGQVPEGFTYQAVARDESGNSLSATDLDVRIAILTNEAVPAVIWEEEHQVTTNEYGLITLKIGVDGTRLSGTAANFGDIDWSQGHLIRTSIRESGGTWHEMDPVSLLSVPYSLIAKDVQAKQQLSKSGNSIILSQGGEVDLSDFTDSLTVVGTDDASTEALFEVRRNDGQPVFSVYPTGVQVFVDDIGKKGTKGGFAIGGFDRAKGTNQDFMLISPDSIRMFIPNNPAVKSAGSKGGFAIGGFDKAKGTESLYFNVSGKEIIDTIGSSPQILWYPLKEAFLAGRVHVGSPDSVGLNSTALGYHSIAKGDFSQAFGYKSMALNQNSTAIGNKAVASGNDSYAFGSGATATGERSFAFGSVGVDSLGNLMGDKTLASGSYSMALGMSSQALNTGALGIGINSKASGPYSTAIGYRSNSSGLYTNSFGLWANAYGDYSMALGMYSGSGGSYSLAMGYASRSYGNHSVSIGSHARSDGLYSASVGYYSRAASDYSYALGRSAYASNSYAYALGRSAQASGQYSSAIGYNASAAASNAYSIGTSAIASGESSLSMGYSNTASALNAVALGISNISNGSNSVTLGTGNTAGTQSNSVAIGNNNSSTGYYSLSFGNSNTSDGSRSVAIGTNSTSSGSYSTAMGYYASATNSYASAVGYKSRAEGSKSLAIGANYYKSNIWRPIIPIIPLYPLIKGTAEEEPELQTKDTGTKGDYIIIPTSINQDNVATGSYSIAVGNGNMTSNGGAAFGVYNTSSAEYGTAIGFANESTGRGSVVAGYGNSTNGDFSAAFGRYTIADAENSFVVGRYNNSWGTADDWVQTDPLFQVGNGSSSTDPHDAFVIRKNGYTTLNATGNATYGLWLIHNGNTSGGTKYALRSRATRNFEGTTYYSGYFYDWYSSGTYYGLYADVRTGASKDLAEYIYDNNNETEPGDVVVADPMGKENVIKSSEPYQGSVLGVVSTKPHLTMGSEIVLDEETGDPIAGVNATRLALAGRVPVKVTDENGPIEPGDPLTTSSTPGHAMKYTPLDINKAKDFDELKAILTENEIRRNAIIGKAVESHPGGNGKIMVLISLQ
ncbi:MAG: hypothetical protein K9J25_06325 [Bacteroidales bacterium]|nr:hypothetical protein [Bacteroidales bacterium]